MSDQKTRRRKAVELHLLDSHYIAVGHVAVRAAMLDKMIEATAEQITRNYPQTIQQLCENELSTPQKLKLIKDVLIKDIPQHKHAILAFISEVSAVRHERNDIVHAIWRGTDALKKDLVELNSNGPEKILRVVTPNGMMKLATQMIDLTFEFADWKMYSNHVRLRSRAASLNIHPRRAEPPIPPRTSVKDQQERRRPGPRQSGS